MMQLIDTELRSKCVEIPPEEFDAAIEFGAKMVEYLNTLDDGMALAANQVGSTRRMFVTGNGGIFLNPEIISPRTKRTKMKPINFKRPIDFKEGCLSLPSTHVEVMRWEKIKLRFTGNNKEEMVLRFHGFESIAIQHEIDHLDGILITDYEK